MEEENSLNEAKRYMRLIRDEREMAFDFIFLILLLLSFNLLSESDYPFAGNHPKP